ncbi:NAD(P)H-dependent amine dehydrogenase family protein [Aquimarina macrocephali]|uniref:NAD(P)H-dependent amine dehydrogenase family protein n=1 Tax=Aquimarina macrocephali TaxID=666563 RepID=UPI003F662F05
MINVIQIGLGPLGQQIGRYIADKNKIQTVAAVDINEALMNQDFGQLINGKTTNVSIKNSIKDALINLREKPDIAILTTVSSIQKLESQIENIAKHGIPIVSTCEELSYPWEENPEVSAKIDTICKKYNIACLGTGVNPGFLMDYLPSVLSSVCKDIESITVERIQDATPRRIPFQQKIGAGLDLKAFKAKEQTGTLRHVGLKESVYFLAGSIGLKLDNVTEELNPVIAEDTISITSMDIKKGDARGVEQISHGYVNGICKIKMHFKAAIGESRSYDRVSIKGVPSFTSEIDTGVNGDIATCAITINSAKSIINASPGLHTMATIAVPGYIN